MSITLTNIKKSYGRQTVVNDISLDIQEGELFVLLGASGSGKSTLLRMIAGLNQPDQGQIFLHGRDVTRLAAQKRDTGFVFQNYSLFQHMTAAQNIAFALNVRRVPNAIKRERVAELLRLIGLEGLGGRYPWQLSGGQQQRVAVARALAHNPSVLLLDEPFGALDVKIRGQLRQNLREIQKALNVTAILVTHDQEEAFELADRIGVIEKGELLEVGEPSQLYRRPKHRFTATFLGTANLLAGQRNGHNVYIGAATLPVPPDTSHLEGKPVEVLFRPEEVELALSAAELNGNLVGNGTVGGINFAGSLERVTVQLTEPQSARVEVLLTPDRARSLSLSLGQSVYLGLKDFHLLATN